jgi:hypothetical protein
MDEERPNKPLLGVDAAEPLRKRLKSPPLVAPGAAPDLPVILENKPGRFVTPAAPGAAPGAAPAAGAAPDLPVILENKLGRFVTPAPAPAPAGASGETYFSGDCPLTYRLVSSLVLTASGLVFAKC